MLLPSENYAPHGQTQQCLLDSLTSDCNKLYEEGIEARYPMMCTQCSVPDMSPYVLILHFTLSSGFPNGR